VSIRLAVACAVVLALGGCAAQDLNRELVPECSVSDEVIAMAQSVPSATQLPCVQSIPLGWAFRSLEVRDGGVEFEMENDRASGVTFGAPHVALEVTLARSCDTSGTTEEVSDEIGIRRYELITRAGSGGRYSGRRFYVFSGGCVTYNFDLPGRGGSELATEITSALTFVTRARVAAVVKNVAGLEL
jgi:hypothetical protein